MVFCLGIGDNIIFHIGKLRSKNKGMCYGQMLVALSKNMGKYFQDIKTKHLIYQIHTANLTYGKHHLSLALFLL